MRKKFIGLVLTLSLAAALLTGCGSSESSSNDSDKAAAGQTEASTAVAPYLLFLPTSPCCFISVFELVAYPAHRRDLVAVFADAAARLQLNDVARLLA